MARHFFLILDKLSREVVEKLQELNMVLDCLEQPAFAALEGKIQYCNAAAYEIGIQTQVPLLSVLEEIPVVTGGMSHFALNYAMQEWNVTARAVEQMQIFILYGCNVAKSDFNALSSAARAMRDPLHRMFTTAQDLFPLLEDLENEEIQSNTARLTHNMYRLLREIDNMADIDAVDTQSYFNHKHRRECNAFFVDFYQEIEPLVRSTGHTLKFSCPEKRFYADINEGLLKRALLNLLSNAIQNSPQNGTIFLSVEPDGHYCRILMKNEGDPADDAMRPGMLNCFEQGNERNFSRMGAGFGLSIARGIARQHGGTILLKANPEGGLTVAMSIERGDVVPGEISLRSPGPQIEPPMGNFKRYLTELADVLDDAIYDSRNI